MTRETTRIPKQLRRVIAPILASPRELRFLPKTPEGYCCNDVITMEDDMTKQFDYPPFPVNSMLDSAIPTGNFPLPDGIPWDDWTADYWQHDDEVHTRTGSGLTNDLMPSVSELNQNTATSSEYCFPAVFEPDQAGLINLGDNEVTEDFTNVSLWLNGAYQPPVPCSYCRQNRLQCLIIQTTPANPNPVTSCSSCVALFRECSLARGEKRQPAGFETVTPVLGHLHGVTEQVDERLRADSQVQRLDDSAQCDEPHGVQSVFGSHGNINNKRQFSRKGAKMLRHWFYQHQEWPYPTHEQKAELARDTGLTKKQVSDWFTNARRRQKQTLQSSRPVQVFRSGSPMPTDGLAFMTPLERWQHSPPEDEPVSESVIESAIDSAPVDSSQSSWNTSNDGEDIFQNNGIDDFTSISSAGSRFSHASSDSIAWSYQSGESLPFQLLTNTASNRSRKKRAHRRSLQNERRYQCTFCIDTFNTKYDWSRHERSVHLSLESWICTPKLAETLQTGHDEPSSSCKFCSLSSPPPSHMEAHEFDICATRPQTGRTFSRKDHLRQHLRKFHHCTRLPNVDVCRFELNNVRSHCGFCGLVLETWSARTDHLAKHFKGGSRMAQWVGDWGLEPSMLTVLRDAVVPSSRGQPQSGQDSGVS